MNVRDCECLQDPPNGALECEMDGIAITTVITITTPVLMMMMMMNDESGVKSLTYVGPREHDARRSNGSEYVCSCRGDGKGGGGHV